MMKAKKSLGLIVVMAWAIFLIMPNQGFPSPLFSLETFDDWYTALNDGRISPVLDPYPAADEHYGVEGTDYIFVPPPTLYVMEDIPQAPSDAGLVMTWGNSDVDLPQLSSWEFVWPEDPDITGTTLSVTVMAPSGIWAVSLTLNDAAGGWVAWDWFVATPGNALSLNVGTIPIAPGVPTTITLDPTIAANQSGSNNFASGGFNPAIATTIQADALAANPGPVPPYWQQFPPVPVIGGQQPWTYWSSLSVTGCGDGVVDPGEECDDGNKIAGDGCDASCQTELCGDGIIQAGLGEQCDDGNTDNGDGCDASCQYEVCIENPVVGVNLVLQDCTGGTASAAETQRPAPANFRIIGGNSYDITFSGSFSTATVCLTYNEGDVRGNENNLKLFHYEDPLWQDITTSLDTVNNEICGEVTSFSDFAVVEAEAEASPPTAVGYSPQWLIITFVSLMIIGGLLLRRRIVRQ